MTNTVLRLIAMNLALLCASARAQEPPPGPSTYIGVKECAFCHSNPNNSSTWADVNVFAKWKDDAHSKAHLALDPATNPLTAKIEAALGKSKKSYSVSKDKNCVACHTKGEQEPVIPSNDPLVANGTVHNGISCETCHGAGSRFEKAHRQPDWRFKTSEEKLKYGMIDLRNPVLKAENCLSCHLGNVEQNKVVTHEMFAAGHPPLPSFEMETFSAVLPAHWKHVWEKPQEIQEAANDAKPPYLTEGESETHRALIGSLVALRKSASALQQQAVAQPAHWPELSHYDCQACHHDLRIPSWRQERGYGGLIPGRPSPHAWPRQIAGVALAKGTTANSLFDPLAAALNKKPFGDPTSISAKAVAPQVIANVDAQIKSVATPGWYGKNREQILDRLFKAGENPADFESARQLVWLLLLEGKDKLGPNAFEGFDKLLATKVEGNQPPFWERSLAKERNYNPAAVRSAFELFKPKLTEAN